MTAEDRQRLTTEQTAITARLEAASEAEKPQLLAQFGERLSQLKARLDSPDAKPAKRKP